MSKKVLEFNFKKQINCSKEVAFWNYWDHEHLDVVHKGYTKSDIMYDSNNFMFRIYRVRIPVFSFIAVKTPIFMVQHDENTLFHKFENNMIIPEYIIDVKNKSKKTLELIEFFQDLKNLDQQKKEDNVIELKDKKKFKKKPFRKKKFFKKAK